MKALIQRTSSAKVTVAEKEIAKIGNGLVVFLGVCQRDSSDDVKKLSQKLLDLRIFPDDQGKMNKSVLDIKGEVLLISQFTLCARTEKGNRPSFVDAANPKLAKNLYNEMVDYLSNLIPTKTGQFGAHMQVSLTNDGPVTIMLDSKGTKG